MSNALALAGGTAVLRDLLNDGVINANLDALGQVVVSSVPPDRLEPANGQEPRNQLNIFLWKVSRNTGWSNERLPSRTANGARLDNPMLALDLHYLLTAVGAAELQAEILLGYGMQVLHETPVLTRDAIRTALGAGGPVDGQILPPAMRQLAASDLADQFEGIRISPVPTDDETLGRLWPAFNTSLRTSALYHVSVVLIESRRPVPAALPVRTIGGRIDQIRRPRIAQVRARPGGPDAAPATGVPIVPGAWIAIDGTSLADERMQLRIGRRVVAVDPARVTDTRITVQLPADLRAGITSIRVEHLYEGRDAADIRLWEGSNVAALAVAPVIALTDGGDPEVDVDGEVEDELFAGTVTVTLAHPVGREQSAAILFNSLPAAPAPIAFARDAEPRQADGSAVGVSLAGVAVGDYLLRVSIDGVESELALGPDGFAGPVVTLGEAP
jgi:hypothetical protein